MLEQYLYRVKDLDKFKELSKSINDLKNELDRRYKILSSEFKEKHVNDIYMFKEKIVELSPDLKEESIDRFGDKLLELLRFKLDLEYSSEGREGEFVFINELLINKILLLVDTSELNEDEEMLLRKKVVSNVIPLLENIIKKLNKDERESIIEFESLLDKLDKTLYKFYSSREGITYWRETNMIHGWFLKNVDWVKEDIDTEIFKGSVLDKLVADLETAITLIENNYDVNDYFFIIEGEDIIYDKIVELFSKPGHFFEPDSIDNIDYQIMKDTLRDLKDKYNPDDNYYYHASW